MPYVSGGFIFMVLIGATVLILAGIKSRIELYAIIMKSNLMEMLLALGALMAKICGGLQIIVFYIIMAGLIPMRPCRSGDLHFRAQGYPDLATKLAIPQFLRG